MTPGLFLDLVSEVTGVPRWRVIGIHRAIRAEGSLASAGRGLNAPHIGEEEAAYIVSALACNGAGLSCHHAATEGAKPENHSRALEALRQGVALSYAAPAKGDFSSGCIISERAIKAISAACVRFAVPVESVGHVETRRFA